MVTKLIISPDFTIEDIHKIREYHYELTKDMTLQEKLDFYKEVRKIGLPYSHLLRKMGLEKMRNPQIH